jgi:hypothetical protein
VHRACSIYFRDVFDETKQPHVAGKVFQNWLDLRVRMPGQPQFCILQSEAFPRFQQQRNSFAFNQRPDK